MKLARTGTFRSAVNHSISAVWPVPMGPIRPSSRRDLGVARHTKRYRSILKYVVLGILLLLVPAISWASFSLLFFGVISTLSTGSINLSVPSGIAVDTAGNTYISDTGHSQIVEVSPQGTASALAIGGLGTPLSSPVGLTLDGSGNLYIADSDNNRVVEVTPSGAGSVLSVGGVSLSSPRGVAVDPSGNIFIADTGNDRIVEVPFGGTAAALAITGLGTPLNTPIGLAVDSSGKLYIADTANNRVVTVAAGGTAGVVLSILGGVTLNAPKGVAVDSFKNVYIADTLNNRIAMVDTAGTGLVLLNTSGNGGLSLPQAVTVDVLGKFDIADTGNNRAAVAFAQLDPSFASTANKTAVGFGHVQLGSSTPVTLTLPYAIGETAVGAVNILTSGTQNLDFTAGEGSSCNSGTSFATCSVVVQFLPTAPGLRTGAVVLYDNSTPPNLMLTVPLYGWGDSPVAALAPNAATLINTGGVITDFPYQLALDGAGNMYVGNYVQVSPHPKVVKIPAGGGTASAVGTGSVTLGTSITGVALDGAGNLYIADYYNNRIVVVTPGGVASVLSISGLSPALGEPTELAFDGAGDLFIGDYAANGRSSSRIVEVTSLVVAGATSSGIGMVVNTGIYTFSSSTITGVAVGPNGTVYIAGRTSNTSHVVQVTAAGVGSLLNPTGVTFSNPQGVFVDAMGNLYVEDAGNTRIVRITAAGVASVLSVSGLTNPSSIASGYGMAADASGNIYIPDWNNSRILFVNVSGGTLTFASTKQNSTSTDSPRTATVTNLGNQALVFSANPTYTASFPNNSADTNPCTSSTSLSGGTVCDVSVTFVPQSVGSLSAGITVTNNTLNVAGSAQQVSVSGTGLNPGDTTSVAVTSNISPANIGQPVTITATVTDTTAGHTSTVPTGPVIFSDTLGSTTTSLNGGSAVNLSAGKAVLSGVTLSGAGSHTITASYAGVSGSFLASMNTGSLTVNKDTATIAGPATQPVPITFGQAGAVIVTFTAAYSAVAPPSGSVTYTILNSANSSVASGTANLTAGSANSTATVPIANSLAPGTYTVSVTYGGDGNNAASTTPTTIQIVVSKNAASIALTASVNPVLVTNSVTFTATVTGLSGTPTGSVSFYDGTTLLGTGTLAQGVAIYTTTSLAIGSHSITAVYGGDTAFATQTSAAVTETVNDFSLNVMTTSSPSATVLPGGTAMYVLAIGPVSGTTFPAPVTLSLSGLPPGATGTLTPQTLPAGSSLTNVTLTIQVPSVTASLPHAEFLAFTFSPFAFGMLLLPFSEKMRRAKYKNGRMASILLFLFAVTLLTGLIGCGSQKSGYFGQSQQNYSVTVTGTSGALVHSTTVTLTVQ